MSKEALASEFAAGLRVQIVERLGELESAVAEHRQLASALDALERSGRPPRGEGSGRRGRPRGSGERAAQALEAIAATPGLTTGEIAEQIGINANYLYRVLPSLEEDGKIRRQDREWHPAAAE